MTFTIDELFTAAEQELAAWKGEGEKLRTDFDYEKLGFLRAVAKRLETNSQNSANAMLCEPKAEPLPPSNCYDPICSSCKQPMDEDEGRWGICNDCIKES